MASSRLFSSLLVISLLLLAINASHSSFEQNNEIEVGNLGYNEKVNVSLYYETLCPGCEHFIVNDLANLFKMKDLMAIINLHLVPYGNAKMDYHKNIVCQHGPHECYYNNIEACALDAWPLEKSFPFIFCVETRLQQQFDEKIWVACSKNLKLDPKIIQSCYENGHGNQLILKNANETAGLKPPHEYVPWVTVNNKPLYEKIDTLISEICNAYKGQGKPKSCKGEVTSSTEKASSKFAVCHDGMSL
ncbi:hypothetical protein L6164_002031 [Bauhinia variegata]|uniref:Uncharacterized protein n=1 Tax=Bauhinia variegata TaxID=167791 RepID=A0ACB9PX40_BAUVA|nr:hypothetical protein L6164_002031 [Bauhinia variegata]